MKIAVLGSAPSSRKLAPFGDTQWDIFACSPNNFDLPRVDAWFELHSLKRKLVPENKPYTDALKRHPRVYVNEHDPLKAEIPGAVPFPFDDLIEEYGKDFFTSSLAWMMAFALEQKPDKIGLWGVDMSANYEYAAQRPGVKFFMREARLRGIKVLVPLESDIDAHMPLYALREQSPMWRKTQVRRQELEQRLAEIREKKNRAKDEELVLTGALDDLNYQENTWCPSEWNRQ